MKFLDWQTFKGLPKLLKRLRRNRRSRPSGL